MFTQLTLKRLSSAPLTLVAITIVPLAFLLVFIAFGSTFVHEQAMRTMVGERDQRAALSAAAAIVSQLNQRATMIQSLALTLDFTQRFELLLSKADQEQPLFDQGLAIVDPAKGFVASVGGDKGWAYSNLTGYLSQLDDGASQNRNAYFTPVYLHPDTKEPVMLVVAKATNGMWILGAFDPQKLIQDSIENIFNPNEESGIFVVDSNGLLLFQLGMMPEGEVGFLQHPGVSEALTGSTGALFIPATEYEHVMAYSPVELVSWALIVEESWESINDPLLEASEYGPLLLIPVLIIATLVLWFVVRQIIRPLQILERQATALGWGDFEAINEPVKGIREIDRLHTELSHMAQKVKVAQESLRSYLGAVTKGQEEERRRLARELHDDTLQSLIAMHQRIQMALAVCEEAEVSKNLEEMEGLSNELMTNLRRMSRALRPTYLEDLGLVPALKMLAQDTQRGANIQVNFEILGGEQRLKEEIELALYRIVQEAFSNVIRHAHASAVDVFLIFASDKAILTIEDNGRGFKVPNTPAEMVPQGHYGLLGLHERSELIGARITIRSENGSGTLVKIVLPLEPFN